MDKVGVAGMFNCFAQRDGAVCGVMNTPHRVATHCYRALTFIHLKRIPTVFQRCRGNDRLEDRARVVGSNGAVDQRGA